MIQHVTLPAQGLLQVRFRLVEDQARSSFRANANSKRTVGSIWRVTGVGSPENSSVRQKSKSPKMVGALAYNEYSKSTISPLSGPTLNISSVHLICWEI